MLQVEVQRGDAKEGAIDSDSVLQVKVQRGDYLGPVSLREIGKISKHRMLSSATVGTCTETKDSQRVKLSLLHSENTM